MNKSSFYFVLNIIVSIAFFYFVFKKEDNNVDSKVDDAPQVKVDTFTITIIDTMWIKNPTIIRDTIIDTMFIEKDETTISLPIEQKHYQEKHLYDIYVSGYLVNLDSCRVYNKITNTIETKNVYIEKKDNVQLFVFGGLNRSQSTFFPKLGATIILKENLYLGAEFGVIGNDAFYGINIGRKIKWEK